MNGHGHNKKKRPAQVWHRWLGFILVIPMLFVCVTGFLLNHVDQLGWNQKQAESDWVLGRYGMKIEGEPVNFNAGGIHISDWGGQLFWNGQALPGASGQTGLIGAVQLTDGIAVVSPRTVSLHDADGTLIEALDEASLPPGQFDKAGVTDTGQLLLSTAEGAVYQFTPDLLSYARSPDPASAWAKPVAVPEATRTAMKQDFRGEGVAWSRVLLDLHSGKFFGAFGRWIVDLGVILLIGLAIVGVVLGIRTMRGNNNGSSRSAATERSDEDSADDLVQPPAQRRERSHQRSGPRQREQPPRPNGPKSSPAGVL